MNRGEIEEHARRLRIRRDAIDHDRILASAQRALRSAQTVSAPRSGDERGRRIILARRRPRFAAAMVFLVFSLGAAYWFVQRGREVAIPAELVAMERAELFDLYVKGSDSFSRMTVRAMVRKSFQGASRDDLRALHASESSDNAFEMRERADLGVIMAFRESTDPDMATARVVEACDLMAQVRIEAIEAHQDDLTAAVLSKYIHDYVDRGLSAAEAEGVRADSALRHHLWRECSDLLSVDFPSIDFLAEGLGERIRTEIELRVVRSYPSLGGISRLVIRPVFDLEELDRWEQGQEFLIALKHHEGLFWLLPGHLGVYTVDAEGGLVAGMIRGELKTDEQPSPTRGRPEEMDLSTGFAEAGVLGESHDEGAGEQLRTAIGLDEAWALIADIYDAIHRGAHPSGGVLDYWTAKLKSPDFIESWMALEYLSVLRGPAVAPSAILAVVEKHLTHPPAGYDPDQVSSYQRTAFLVDAIRVLLVSADEAAVDRLMTLYEKSLVDSQDGFYRVSVLKDDLTDKMLRLSLKLPGPERRRRFLIVFSPMADSGRSGTDHDLEVMLPEMLAGIEEDDIDVLLWDMVQKPAGFGICDAGVLQTVWILAAQRILAHVEDYLGEVLADPDNAAAGLREEIRAETKDIVEAAQLAIHWHVVACEAMGLISRTEAIERLIDQYKGHNVSMRYNNTSVIGSIAELIEPTDTQFLPFFARVLAGGDGYPGPNYLTSLLPVVLTAERMFDPSLVPAVRGALRERVTGRLLEILYYCGQQEEAVGMALPIIEALVNDDPAWRESVRKWYEFEDLAGLVYFLGATEDPQYAPVVEQFTDGPVFERLYKECTDGATELQRAAVLALGRLGDAGVIPHLRKLYASDDTYIRILAAWSLFHLGDNLGAGMIAHFVNHTERSQPDLELHWDQWYGCDDLFRMPLMYLRSPETDALLLESLNNLAHGFSPDRFLGQYGYGYAFLKKYKQQVLPILVAHLNSTNRRARESANGLLKTLTGRDFGFCEDMFAGQQVRVVERWRDYVAEYLSRYE